MGLTERFRDGASASRCLLMRRQYRIGLRAPLYLPSFTPLPHQLEVAQKVVEKMNGKAILADEVGLGKTVEAGLILKEYMIRGLAKKILILVPASLVSQWVKELQEKFLIPGRALRGVY